MLPKANTLKGILGWALFILVIAVLYTVAYQPAPKPETPSYSEFMERAQKGEVQSIVLRGREVSGKYKNGREFHIYAPDDPDMIKSLRETGVVIRAEQETEPAWKWIVSTWLPIGLMIVVWVMFFRQIQVGGGKAMSFAKSRAKLLTESTTKVTFKDVAGIEEAKRELEEIIDFLRDPKKFTKLGGRIPKGVLLVGPPGTGKTLLARAIAGEAGVPFFSISGSDFVEMFVGVGASRVRDLFVQAKKHAPCIIFIDEIDAVGRLRGAGLGGGHDEREQTLNQLLVEMDGFESNEGIILISATNRPDVLDPALLRPGRFDRRVVVARPDLKGREEILKVHTRKIPLAEDVSLATVARGTPGFSGADLENLVNEAALLAARVGKASVERKDLEEAKDKVLMGVERRSMIISETEKRNTAYHEGGHALVAKLVPGADPVHKVTIIPRGLALGATQQLPVDDRYTHTKAYLKTTLAVLMGGRAAEELVLNQITTGAGNDIEKATDLARKMVCEWGMSERLGPLAFGKKEEAIFLGRELAQHADYSEATAVEIDREVKDVVMEAYNLAKKLLSDHLDLLHRLAHRLLEKEALDGEEIDQLLKEQGIIPANPAAPTPSPTPPLTPAAAVA